MKKILGLILAGVMVMSLSVFAFATEASNSGSSGLSNATAEDLKGYAYGPSTTYEELVNIKNMANPEAWAEMVEKYGDPFAKFNESSSSGGSSVEGYDEDYAAAALAAKEMGLSMDILQGAEDANKSVGEYLNNSVNSIAGVPNATPIAQGGNVIIDGMPSNQTFSVNKPLPAHIEAAKAQAVAVGGRIMNCVDVDAGVYFGVANVNFYTPGVTGAENVQVYHFTGGQWIPMNVTEVRQDHIVVDITATGIFAFIEVPAEAAAE